MNDFSKLAKANPALAHDPFVKSMIRREVRHAENALMQCMNRYPSHSGWILLLQNRVCLGSVGNVRHKTKVYYDSRSRMVGPSPDSCTTPFRCARLGNGQPAAGWMDI